MLRLSIDMILHSYLYFAVRQLRPAHLLKPCVRLQDVHRCEGIRGGDTSEHK
jgi:hypothetical protein